MPAHFEELCQDLFRSTLEKVPRDSKIYKSLVHEIVVVQLVFNLSSSWYPITLMARNDKRINPDEAVAYGSTVQAAFLSSDTSEIYSFTPPYQEIFPTYFYNQPGVLIQIFEVNMLAPRINLSRIPPALCGVPQIAISMPMVF